MSNTRDNISAGDWSSTTTTKGNKEEVIDATPIPELPTIPFNNYLNKFLEYYGRVPTNTAYNFLMGIRALSALHKEMVENDKTIKR